MTFDAPFVGLRPFESRESLLFFGRQEQTIALLQRLHQHHFVAVIGSSGSGKSSLVRAGLIPQLKAGFLVNDRSNWMIAIMKPGQNPICHLAEAILNQPTALEYNVTPAELENQIKAKGVDAALDVLKPLWNNNTNFFLLVDQFEELFRFSQNQKEIEKKDEAIDFVNIMLQLSRQPDLPLYVLITMRSDFIGDCAQFFGLPEAMNQSQYLVPRLNRVQLQSIIEDPVKLYGGRISTALTARLLNDLQVMKDELPLLQHALMRIWISDLQNNNNGELDLDDYEKIGGIEKALSNHADEAIEGMSAAELGLTKKIFQALTTIDENARKIRRPVHLKELMDITGATEQQLLLIINKFIEGNKNFLVINEIENTNDLLIDISHESLIRQWSKLNEWADEEAESGKIFLRLTESATLYKQKKGNLLSGTELQQVAQWHNGFHPNTVWAKRYSPDFEKSIQYLKQSKLQWRAEKDRKEKERYRKLRNLRILFALAMAVTVLIGFLAYLINRNNTKTHNQLARNYWSTSQAVRKENSLKSLLYLAEAVGISKDRGLTKGLLIDVQSSLPQMKLEYILSHDNAVYTASFSQDDSLLLTGGYDSTARLWNMATGAQAGASMQHQGAVKTAVFSPDGQLILTASDDGTARIWDVTTGRQMGPSMKHNGNVNSAIFNRQGTLILTASNDSTARLWDVSTGRQTGPSMQHMGFVSRAVFNAQGTQVVTASYDHTARLWSAETGEQIGASMKHKDSVYWADFSPDGNQIVTSGKDSTAKVWDVITLKQTGPDMKHENTVSSAIFSPDGKRIVTASNDKTARLWDALTLTQLGPEMKHDNAVNSAVFSPDGKFILTSGYDRTARLWEAETGIEPAPFIKQEAIIYNAIFSPRGKRMVTVCGDHTARVWSLRDNNPLTLHSLNQQGTIYHAIFSADEKGILLASSDSTARIVDALTGNQILRLNHNGFVNSAVFSPDESQILTAGSDSIVCIWDAKTGKRIGLPINQNTGVLSAAFTADGNLIVTAGTDGSAKVWDKVSGKQKGRSFTHNGSVMSAVFSADGSTVLTSGYDSSARQWNMAIGKQAQAFIRTEDVLFNAVFSADNKRILTSGADGTARIWDAVYGKQIGPALKHNGPVKTAVFSADQRWILTASWDNTARLWEAESGNQIGPGFQHEAPLNSAMFSRDEKRILTAGYAGTAGIWMLQGDLDLSPELFKLQARAITGSELNNETGEIEGIPAESWYILKNQYADKGKAHYQHCKYPEYNLWRYFYPDLAKKIRPDQN